MMILLVVIIIAVIYYSSKGRSIEYSKGKYKNPEEILKERFVNGEIDESTYLQMKLILNK